MNKKVWIEQLGAASSEYKLWGVAHAEDLLEKMLPGAMARLKVARDDEELDGGVTLPFVEQLGVASGRYGLPQRKRLAAALLGLYVKWDVSKYWGIDWRNHANTFIEHKVLPLPMDDRKKALLITLLYEGARKLPGR